MLYIDYAECTLCALSSRLSELEKFNRNDEGSVRRIVVRISNELPRGRSRVFVGSFDELSRIVNLNDPYSVDKANYEKVAREHIVPRLMGLGDVELVKAVAAANAVDVNMLNYRFSSDMLLAGIGDRPIMLGLREDELGDILAKPSSITYIVDNAGEFAIDEVLIRRLANHAKVTVVARLMPYETDVTYDYVKSIFSDNQGIRVVNTGDRYPAFLNNEVYERYIAGSDLVISKGVGNFEAYLEGERDHPNTLFLFRVKCRPIERMLNVGFNSPVILHSRYLKGLRQ